MKDEKFKSYEEWKQQTEEDDTAEIDERFNFLD
jgi:hypothetical protein